MAAGSIDAHNTSMGGSHLLSTAGDVRCHSQMKVEVVRPLSCLLVNPPNQHCFGFWLHTTVALAIRRGLVGRIDSGDRAAHPAGFWRMISFIVAADLTMSADHVLRDCRAGARIIYVGAVIPRDVGGNMMTGDGSTVHALQPGAFARHSMEAVGVMAVLSVRAGAIVRERRRRAAHAPVS